MWSHSLSNSVNSHWRIRKDNPYMMRGGNIRFEKDAFVPLSGEEVMGKASFRPFAWQLNHKKMEATQDREFLYDHGVTGLLGSKMTYQHTSLSWRNQGWGKTLLLATILQKPGKYLSPQHRPQQEQANWKVHKVSLGPSLKCYWRLSLQFLDPSSQDRH